MSRFDTFTNIHENKIKDLTDLLDQVGLSADLYSSQPAENDTGETVGFNTEVPSPTFKKKILVIMNLLNTAQKNQNEGGEVSSVQYLCKTNYKHIFIDDYIVVKGRKYRVLSLNELTVDRTEFTVEVQN